MAFVKVALLKNLEPDKMIGVEAGGKEIVAVNPEGKIHAIGNRCTHMSYIQSDGTLKV